MSANVNGPDSGATEAARRVQQLEKINFVASLKNSPDAYSEYQKERVKKIMNNVGGKKTGAFTNAQDQLDAAITNTYNMNQYLSRTMNVESVADTMLQNNEGIRDSIERDKEISRRQFEINEWSNYNKLDTLFYLQLLFICSLIATIIMYLTKSGVFSLGFAVVLYGILGSIVLIVGYSRYSYTGNTRDRKLWHRRYFPAVPSPGTGDGCPPANMPWKTRLEDALRADVNAIASCTSNIIGKAENSLNQFGSAAVGEVQGIIQGNASSLSQMGAGICNKN
jgi:hypothetical protein